MLKQQALLIQRGQLKERILHQRQTLLETLAPLEKNSARLDFIWRCSKMSIAFVNQHKGLLLLVAALSFFKKPRVFIRLTFRLARRGLVILQIAKKLRTYYQNTAENIKNIFSRA